MIIAVKQITGKKINFTCYRKQRVNGPYFTHFTLLKFFFINKMSSLLNCLRFGTVILLQYTFEVTYKKICFILVNISKNFDILGTLVDP